MKKINACLVPLTVLALLCIGAESNSGRPLPRPALHKTEGIASYPAWFSGDIVFDADWFIMQRDDIFEVGASKLKWTFNTLASTGIRKLTAEEVGHYAGHDYHCESGKTPFLIRAVYEKDGPGGFRAERHGNSLAIVNHGHFPVLGSGSGEYEWTAVVVNLDFTPDEVYTEVSAWH